jgi:hypothetical protein
MLIYHDLFGILSLENILLYAMDFHIAMIGPLTIPTAIYILVGFLSVVLAASDQNPFSNILFQAFSEFVNNNFNSQISLATVITVLFTLTNNPDLLNLYACQQHIRSQKEIVQMSLGG